MSVELVLAVVEAGEAGSLLDRMPENESCYAGLLKGKILSRLQLGSEFCQRLLPSPEQVHRIADLTESRGLGFSLVTPLATDRTIGQLRRLLPLLPSGSEIIANDWGVLRLLKASFPSLVPVAGRLICKQIKDPRLPSAEWAALYPHGIHSRGFAAVLQRFGVGRVEMDVPVFAEPENFHSSCMQVSVHAPWGFAVKGRACRIGSLNQPDDSKFATDHRCRRECLTYAGRMTRDQGGDGDLTTVQRGNTMFYRHNPEMAAAVISAVAAGFIDRVIMNGGWP